MKQTCASPWLVAKKDKDTNIFSLLVDASSDPIELNIIVLILDI